VLYCNKMLRLIIKMMIILLYFILVRMNNFLSTKLKLQLLVATLTHPSQLVIHTQSPHGHTAHLTILAFQKATTTKHGLVIFLG